ncbi:MAG TPA: ABC transporter permease [Dehalococcoidia bacterium]|jgi:peptide/nickel transport system permease protein
MLEEMQAETQIVTLPVRAPRISLRPLRIVKRYPLGVLSAMFLVTIISVALLAPQIAPYSPTAADFGILEHPSNQHLFGTDRAGRDVFSRVVWGSRASLSIGLLAATFGAVTASAMGIIAGYYQRWPDYLVQRSSELLAMIPDLIFLFLWVVAFGPGYVTMISALAVGGAFGGVRVIRGGIIAEKHAAYIEAAQSIGASGRRVILKHLLPNTISLIIVLFTLRIPAVILAEASLSFLGLGIPPPNPSWGADLGGTARTYFRQQPWLALAPGIALSLTVLSFSLLGDAVRDALDPRLRGSR